MGISLQAYCELHHKEELLRQWHPDKNAPLTAKDLTHGSNRKVWWICRKGHEWKAAVYSRTGSDAGCPVCAGKQVLPGYNDLASQFPRVAVQWHPARNKGLAPELVAAKSHRKVWWRCERGHEFFACVSSRTRQASGCPYCAGRRILPGFNDLQTLYPQVAAQWHPARNGDLDPRTVLAGSVHKAWWRCEKGHEWQAAVISRTRSAVGCPICAGKTVVSGENDLETLFPEVAREWHPVKNGTLTTRTVSPYSNRKVWWICALGHEYSACISSRTYRATGCPYCAGRMVLTGFNDLQTLHPQVAAQWHPALNGALTPEQVTAGSHRKVWWECSLGHVWKAVIFSRTASRACGCPACAGKVRESQQRKYARLSIPEPGRNGQK